VGGPDPARGAQEANLSLLQKLKLYNGKTLPGFTEDNVKELRKEADPRGHGRHLPRYVQDKISNALVSERGQTSINPFMVMNELESGLAPQPHHQRGDRKRYRELLRGEARSTRTSSRTRSSARSRPTRTRSRALRQLHRQRQGLHAEGEGQEPYTGQDEEPDERLMRSIEEKIDIPESRKDDFRREIMNYIGALAIEGKKFDYRPTSACTRRSS
jgi:serine protein kinase